MSSITLTQSARAMAVEHAGSPNEDPAVTSILFRASDEITRLQQLRDDLSDSLAEALELNQKQPDWEAFGHEVMSVWPIGDLDGGRLQELAEKHRVIRSVEGGFNPMKHLDFEGAAEPGDPWFERNY